MSEERLSAVGRILSNSAALFVISLFAKGAGLIIAIIVARYLGPGPLGVYAVLMAIAMILEILSPLGLQDFNVRAAARDPQAMWRLFAEGSVISLLVSLVLAAGLAGIARTLDLAPDVLLSVDFVALSLVFAGPGLVALSVLQGIERMRSITVATTVGRVLGLILTIVMLEAGAGVYAAFAGRVVFHAVGLAMMARTAYGYSHGPDMAPTGKLHPVRLLKTMKTTLPFALQRLLQEAAVRGNVLILPLLISITSVGLFDAADRIRQTLATLVPIVIMAVMPAFSRAFEKDREEAALLAATTLKYLMIAMLPLAALLAAAAPAVISLLYGNQYDASVPVLQIVIWAQALVAADMVIKQIMIASNRERAMLVRSALGVSLQLALIVFAARSLDLTGIAAAIVAGAGVLLLLDMSYVARHVVRLPVARTLGRPLASAALSGGAALLLAGQSLLVIVPVAAVVYLLALFALRTFSADELGVLRGLPGHFLGRGSRAG